MPPEQMQVPPTGQEMAQPSPQMGGPNDMTTDEIAATLGFITTLSEQMLPAEEADEEVADPEDPEGEDPQDDLGSAKDEIIGEIGSLRDDMVSDEMKQKFAEIQARLAELEAEEEADENDNGKNKEGEN